MRTNMTSERAISINELHELMLENLKKIIEICEKNNIQYYLAYGSLLGAVRHGGFIPWDDDLDIMMKRQDFERFVKYCQENADELQPYKLLSYDLDKSYPYPIPRFCNLDYLLKSDMYQADEMGVYIDVYPLDSAGKEHDLEAYKRKYNIWLRAVFHSIRPKSYPYPSKLSKFVGTIIDSFLSKPFVRSRIFKSLYNMKDRFDIDSSDYLACVIWEPYPVYKKEYFSKACKLKFEDIEANVPIGYDMILSQKYGDYMVLPPEDKRHPTHSYSIVHK